MNEMPQMTSLEKGIPLFKFQEHLKLRMQDMEFRVIADLNDRNNQVSTNQKMQIMTLNNAIIHFISNFNNPFKFFCIFDWNLHLFWEFIIDFIHCRSSEKLQKQLTTTVYSMNTPQKPIKWTDTTTLFLVTIISTLLFTYFLYFLDKHSIVSLPEMNTSDHEDDN